MSPFGVVFAKVFEELAASQMTAFIERAQGDLRRAARDWALGASARASFKPDGCSARSRSMRATRSFSKWTTTQRRISLGRAAAAEVVGVVPSVAVEAVGDHRRAEQELDLAARHADVDLDDVLVVEQVALLDVDAIDASREGQSQRERSNGTRNLMSRSTGRGGAAAAVCVIIGPASYPISSERVAGGRTRSSQSRPQGHLTASEGAGDPGTQPPATSLGGGDLSRVARQRRGARARDRLSRADAIRARGARQPPQLRRRHKPSSSSRTARTTITWCVSRPAE